MYSSYENISAFYATWLRHRASCLRAVVASVAEAYPCTGMPNRVYGDGDMAMLGVYKWVQHAWCMLSSQACS